MTVAIVSGPFGTSAIVGIAGKLGLGIFVGTLNGFLVVRTDVPSLVGMLATFFGVAGLTPGPSII